MLYHNLVGHVGDKHPIKRVVVVLNALIQGLLHVVLSQLEEPPELALLDNRALVVLVQLQVPLYYLVDLVRENVHYLPHPFVDVVLLRIFKVRQVG